MFSKYCCIFHQIPEVVCVCYVYPAVCLLPFYLYIYIFLPDSINYIPAYSSVRAMKKKIERDNRSSEDTGGFLTNQASLLLTPSRLLLQVFKVLVRKTQDESWVVFRRYTDFSRLNDKVSFRGFCDAYQLGRSSLVFVFTTAAPLANFSRASSTYWPLTRWKWLELHKEDLCSQTAARTCTHNGKQVPAGSGSSPGFNTEGDKRETRFC